uniref:Lipocalin n=1 Tax=Rhipicephalus appendiculatus TaxID=34631 RepID=A0A131YSL6_RHIAP
MWEKQLCVAALFAAIMTTVYSACSSPCTPNNLYIQDFFNTTLPIWVLNSTTTTMLGCKVDVPFYIAGSTIYFGRIYTERRTTIRRNLTGTITTKEMDRIYIIEGRTCQQEQLVFMSYDRSCAVVKVTISNPRTSPYYELRVRNDSFSSEHLYECQVKYRSQKGEGHRVYAEDCQRILRPGCQVTSCYFG